MTASAIAERIRAVSLMTSLRPEHRLHAKLDLSAEGIERRIRRVSQLRDLCRRLRASRLR